MTTQDEKGLREALASAMAYAMARTDLPGKDETSRGYAERLAPLVIESGYLDAAHAPAALDVAWGAMLEDVIGLWGTGQADKDDVLDVLAEHRPFAATSAPALDVEDEWRRREVRHHREWHVTLQTCPACARLRDPARLAESREGEEGS